MLLLLASCAYEPPLAETTDYPHATTLSGEMVLASGVPDTDTRVGHVLLYDINDLPPPKGFGAPLDFTTTRTEDWGYTSVSLDTGAPVNGVASAEWAMAGVPDGTWLLTALVDNDGDFSPFPGISDYAGGAPCGDQVGAYVTDAVTGTPVPITTTAPDHIAGLDLVVGPPIPFERPAFEMWTADAKENGYAPLEQVNTLVIDPTLSPLAVPQVINLISHPVAHPMLTLNPTASANCPTTFTVIRRDIDGDGAVDPHPSVLGGVDYEDVYPIVLMALVLDADGNEPEGTIISPLPIRPTYDTSVPAETPFTTTQLQLLFTGTFLEIIDGEQVEYEGDPPEGVWGVAVLNENGQMWQVPNGLSDPDTWPEFADSIDPTQGAVVVTAVGD